MNSSNFKPLNQLIHTRVVSQTPGRLRLKISEPHRKQGEMAEIVNALNAHPNVSEVRMNLQTGSIVVHHDNYHDTVENVFATLRDVGMIFGDIVLGKSVAANGVTDAVSDLNQRVSSLTHGVVDLRFLLPVGFGTLAVRQLMAKGLQFDIIPWYVLAWYSFDSFIKLHYTADPHKKNSYQPTGR
ncbi:HMA2 domain-containing protein [Microcoleus sp. FACHB-672]|uniref:HMA2 domain-containing protein n=1 Tax=Microcoleus sp. FACHB-672 TaxID=2692825 RepID=UPI0016840D93|nr:hypothetical protein [Microcoleus sp. FACHB-672]MBD2043338.1 hypothetical protein [Microcoleus sp. FACHB-672]